MLKRETREKLQALVQHPDFSYISVEIRDRKMFHTMDKGKPSFSVDVSIHTEGQEALTRITSLIPEILIAQHKANRTEHNDHISIGEYAGGTLEGATVSFWSTFHKIPKEKAPTAMGAVEEIYQPQCTIDVSKVESLVESEVVANA